MCISGDATIDLLALLAVVNSRIFGYLVSIQLARTELAQSYEVGLIQQTPVPVLSASDTASLAQRARYAWSLKRTLDTTYETSHAFLLPVILRDRIGRFDLAAIHTELARVQSEIDERCMVLYGLDESDRAMVTEGFDTRGPDDASSDVANDAEDEDEDDTGESESTADATDLAEELLSWTIGVAFGRFDIRLATGARPMPPEPEPFDPLPSCSSGMLTGDDGLPLARPPAGYPLSFPVAGVLVDDPGHAQDLPTAMRAVFDVVFGDEAERWWDNIAALLDPMGHELRGWLSGSFFEQHLKRYSRNRRKAPILWQLGVPSRRCSVWLYAHRLTRDSFFQLENEVVGPKLTHEERQLMSQRQNAGASPSAAERKEIAAQEALVKELRTMLMEVRRVAPLWNPDLDDGVVLTMAPIWRLVPQHKAWQKELKGKWDELAAGKYDWAHLAMHLWPERVVPKCATDRSLAIAHGLEAVFWVAGPGGKWTPRPAPARPVDELVRERTSTSVKDALESLLEAPVVGSASGTRRRSASRSTS